MKLQELDYKIIYFPGALNKTADLLSRPPVESITKIEVGLDVDWGSEQDKDRDLAILKVALKNGDAKEFSNLENGFFWNSVKDNLLVEQGILKYTADLASSLVVVPKHLTKEICKIYHDSITAGHLGFEKTLKSIVIRFYWSKMKTEIYDYCVTCSECQKFKPKNTTNKSPLITIKVEKPWDLVGIDIAGPLKLTANGNKYIMLAIDYISKFCITDATKYFKADQTTIFVDKEIVNVHGVPYAVLSDQGTNFESKCFTSTVNRMESKRFVPQAIIHNAMG